MAWMMPSRLPPPGFCKNVAAVRDKTVVAFDREKLAKLEIESPRGAVTLTREGEQWRITAPQAAPADNTVVGTLLFQLRELKAQGFLDDVRMTESGPFDFQSSRIVYSRRSFPAHAINPAQHIWFVELRSRATELVPAARVDHDE